jgi:hypothetical protein
MDAYTRIDLPVTDDQAQRLLREVALTSDETEPVKLSHGLALSNMPLPGRWLVYAVRREYLEDGRPQHWASFEWQAPVT